MVGNKKAEPLNFVKEFWNAWKFWGFCKTGNLGCRRRALINLSSPSKVVQEPNSLNDFTHEVPD